jgi:phospholipid/cholesterol/gamma-HCH transport system substrate-binding protein
MNEEKKTEIKVGITVFVAIILFLLIYGWAKNINVSSDEKLLFIEFPTVAGLEIGDLVSVQGVRKGLVNTIEADNNSALVTIKLNEEVELKEDAQFSIMMLDLMGGKKIEISAGTSSSIIDYSKVQKGVFAGDISTAMATLHSVEADLIATLSELKTSLEYANNFIGDNNFSNNLKESVKQLNLLTYNINNLVTTNKESLNSAITNTKEITESTKILLEGNSSRFSSVLIKLDSTLSVSNHLISDFSRFTTEVMNSQNNLGKIIYDQELLTNLQNSLKQIEELTTIINKQLKSGGIEVKADIDLF